MASVHKSLALTIAGLADLSEFAADVPGRLNNTHGRPGQMEGRKMIEDYLDDMLEVLDHTLDMTHFELLDTDSADAVAAIIGPGDNTAGFAAEFDIVKDEELSFVDSELLSSSLIWGLCFVDSLV